jgi:hypothetical protein
MQVYHLATLVRSWTAQLILQDDLINFDTVRAMNRRILIKIFFTALQQTTDVFMWD